jgi:hypothetical protein
MPCNDARRQDAIMAQLQSTLTTHANVVAIVAGDWNMDLTEDRLSTFMSTTNLTKINIVDGDGNMASRPYHTCMRRTRDAP